MKDGTRFQAEYDPCPICGSVDFTPLFRVPFPFHSKSPHRGFPLDHDLDVPSWRIARCERCTVEVPNPRPTEASIRDYYAMQAEPSAWEVENYVEIPEKGRAGWRSMAEKLTRLHGSTGSLLEIGCAAGWLLQGARELGWEVQGIEASPKFQKYASSVLKLPVHLGTLDTVDLGSRKFDVVVMADVIEHLYDPVADLRRIRDLLEPDGTLFLETCDIGSLCARFWGLEWRQIVISHTFYWTRKSMREALSRAGFRVERFSEPRYWHPNLLLEQIQRAREIGKLAGRVMMLKTYVPLANRLPAVRRLVKTLSFGRLDHSGLLYRVGDQPVLGDVMVAIAYPDATLPAPVATEDETETPLDMMAVSGAVETRSHP